MCDVEIVKDFLPKNRKEKKHLIYKYKLIKSIRMGEITTVLNNNFGQPYFWGILNSWAQTKKKLSGTY